MAEHDDDLMPLQPDMEPEEVGFWLKLYLGSKRSVEDLDANGANLRYADLTGQNLSGVRLQGADLEEADLHMAQLVGADLQRSNLRGADLRETDFSMANLTGVDLRGADLFGANLVTANVLGATIDYDTYRRSQWTPEDLLTLTSSGANLVGIEAFPVHVQRRLLDMPRGLTLRFSTRLSSFDRLLVENVVHVTLGRDTNCLLAEYLVQGDTAVVRLESACRDDLEAVAEALYHRVWELQEREHEAELGRLTRRLTTPQIVNNYGTIGVQNNVQGNLQILPAIDPAIVTRLQKLQSALGASLSDLVDRLERMELRLPSEDAAADQTAAASARRELKLVRTWDPGTHPRTALDRLLAMLEPDELRFLLARGPEGAEVVAWVPAGAVAPMVIASQAADELVRRGLVDEGFFARLVVERPDLEEAVWRVARMWQEHEAG